jgi:hypothetical protein
MERMKMKLIPILVALALVFSISAVAMGAKKAPSNKVKGEITKIDGDKLTVKVGKKSDPNAREVAISTDANTKVVLADGTDGKVSDLKTGIKVTVTPAEGTATRIEVQKGKAGK